MSAPGPPPPRRKSCGECVKANRRCDQRNPACLRCVKKKLNCVYVRQPAQWLVANTRLNDVTETTNIVSTPNTTKFSVNGPEQITFAPTPVDEFGLGDFCLELNSGFELPTTPMGVELENVLGWQPEQDCGNNILIEPYATPPSDEVYKVEDYSRCVRDLADPSPVVNTS